MTHTNKKKKFIPFSAQVTNEHLKILRRKKILLKLNGSYKKTWLEKDGKIKFNFPVHVENNCCFIASGGFFNMGAFSYSKTNFRDPISVGRYCSLASGIIIMPADHPINRVSTSGIDYANNALYFNGFKKSHFEQKPLSLSIGNDVWIASDCILGRNVKISDGAVVGIRSIVTKDVPPYAVVAGAPATVKKLRFHEKIVESLIDTSWYNLMPEDLAKFDTTDPVRFIDQVAEFKETREYSLYTPNVIALHKIFAISDDSKENNIITNNSPGETKGILQRTFKSVTNSVPFLRKKKSLCQAKEQMI